MTTSIQLKLYIIEEIMTKISHEDIQQIEYNSNLSQARRRWSEIQEMYKLKEKTAPVEDSPAVRLDLARTPVSFLKIAQTYVPRPTKMKIDLFLSSETLKERFDRPITEFGTIKTLVDAIMICYLKYPSNIEVKMFDRWYPAKLSTDGGQLYGSDERYIRFGVNLRLGDETISVVNEYLYSSEFKDENGTFKEGVTIEKLLNEMDLRLYDPERWEDYDEILGESLAVTDKIGSQLWFDGTAITIWKQWWYTGIDGTELKGKVIVEPVLEVEKKEDRYDRKIGSLTPMIRVFSPGLKRYMFVDYRDCKPYDYDIEAIDKLALEPKIKNVLNLVFRAEGEMFGDLLKGKHGGMVIMAAGSTGTGKTATAEAFAESTRRPLYSMEVAELGLGLADIEQNLQKIFMRAKRWNAVLLLDEADIFMAERDNDLQRSAVVGVFLRLLDYYPGTLFLTTNRPEILDKAFKSRITIQLDYPELDQEKRKFVWEKMLSAAKVKVNHGTSLESVAALKLNGRQIRNMTRLLKVLHPEENVEITSQELEELCQFACKI